ncbi:MAG: hypothetical protein AAB890_03175 [Patescibacteria group bacterium]
MVTLKDKRAFIEKHLKEINVLADAALLKYANIKEINEEDADNLLRLFESHLFVFKKNKTSLAQNVLLTIDNPGSYNAFKPIICALENDCRCGSISVIASGIARKNFQQEFSNRFVPVRNNGLFISEFGELFSDIPPDIIICSISFINGPESIALYAGKSVLGAKKIYTIIDGWGVFGNIFKSNLRIRDAIDGFFCNDEFAKKIIKYQIPDITDERIYATGTPVLDSIEIKKSDEYRQTMRKRFYLEEDTVVLLFIGGVSENWKNKFASDSKINEITFEKTIIAMKALAKAYPDKKFALLLKPHPRDADKQELYSIADSMKLPLNLAFVDVAAVSINEAAYGADVIASIVSTENLLAPLRGKQAIYLGYEGVGLGKELLEKVYGKDILSFLSETQGVTVAASPEEFSVLFLNACYSKISASSIKIKYGNSAKKIIDVIFEK